MTGRRRLSRYLAGAFLAAGVVAALVLLNLLLLGSATASHDPVGHLSLTTKLPPAPAWTVRPATGHVEHNGADD